MSIFNNIAGEFKTRNFSMYDLVVTCSRYLFGTLGRCARLSVGNGRYLSRTFANQSNL